MKRSEEQTVDEQVVEYGEMDETARVTSDESERRDVMGTSVCGSSIATVVPCAPCGVRGFFV